MARHSKSLLWGLFLLRFGLGLFLALWSINKIINPNTAATIFADSYLLHISPSIAMIIGSIELVLSLFFMFGMYKTWSYGLCLLTQFIATTAALRELIMLGKNYLLISALPLLFAFTAVFVMRNLDTKWTLTKKTRMFAE